MATMTLFAPSAATTYSTRGATYTPNASGLITGVPTSGYDLPDLIADGCVVVSNAYKVGTPGPNVTAVEYGVGHDHTTVLTFGPGAVLPAIAGGAALQVGVLVYTLPPGAQWFTAAQINVGITQTQGNINASVPAVGVGSIIGAAALATLTGTKANILASVSAANCTGTPTVSTGQAAYAADVGGARTVYFNAAATWPAGGDAAAILTGTITLYWRTIS